MNKYHCKEKNCKNEISKWNFNYGMGFCRSHAHTGERNGKYINGGVFYCIDCEKRVSRTSNNGNGRCRKCAKQGKLHPHWKGGVGSFPYPIEFMKLREKIRKRDNFTCQKCRIKQENYVRKLDIHHIDYNKENYKENNLITLCNKCNVVVNFNRDYWFGYFTKLMERIENVII